MAVGMAVDKVGKGGGAVVRRRGIVWRGRLGGGEKGEREGRKGGRGEGKGGEGVGAARVRATRGTLWWREKTGSAAGVRRTSGRNVLGIGRLIIERKSDFLARALLDQFRPPFQLVPIRHLAPSHVQ